MLELINRIRLYFHTKTDEHHFNYQYANRNREEVLKPFLDLLGSEYLILNQDLVIVKQIEPVSDRLESLGFLDTSLICPQTKKYFQIFQATQDLFKSRLYHLDYNFELFLTHEQDWNKLLLTRSILSSMSLSEKDYFRQFIVIYRLIQQKCPTI